ncbi:isocitrate/isopropylmalate family dehydrogenase, partial [Clostridium perfringens]
LLGLRSALGPFANIRPATIFPALTHASSLKPDVVEGLDIVIVRELTGDVYFGDKGQRTTDAGLREGYDLMRYDENEVRRIATVGFEIA